ncbi:unnamed protein product [Diabrotica balteata]|uniref:Uncharacterized protein n=1 Tax=Diabrotica balteata TaxID=107213 RepID=A0A9N9STK2_DIABA|nr:unnamed protein product [Diabrotica balteata]
MLLVANKFRKRKINGTSGLLWRESKDDQGRSCPAKVDGDLFWPDTEESSCSTSQPICLNTNLEISKRCCGENSIWDESPKCYSLQQDIINPCPDAFVGVDNICMFAIVTTYPPNCPFAETLPYDEYAEYIQTVQYPIWLPINREDGTYGKGLFYWNEQSELYKTPSGFNVSYDELLLDNHCLILIKPQYVKAVPCDELHTAICAYRTLPERTKSFCSQTLGLNCKQSSYSPKSVCFCKQYQSNGNKIELQMPYQNLLYTSLDEVCDIGLERKDNQYFWTYSNVSIEYTNWSPNTEFGTNFAYGAMSSDGWVLRENKFDNKCSLIETFPPNLNDSLVLNYNNISSIFTVSVTNAAYWKQKDNVEEPLLFCYTDAAEDLIVKRLDITKGINNNIFTFLASDGPGHYWCEGFLYPELEVRKSNVYFLPPTNPEYIAVFFHHFTADNNPLSTEYLQYVQNLLKTGILESLPLTSLYPRIMKIVDIFATNSTAVLNFHLTTKTDVDLFQTYSDLLNLDVENFFLTSMLIYSTCIGSETQNAEGKKVLWPTTPFGETAVKPFNDWCVNKEGIVITRTCGGNFIDGAVWSELDRNCFSPESVSPTLILANLLKSCALKYLKLLEDSSSRITSLSDFTSLISGIMQIPPTILKQSQQTYKSTDSILHSVGKILEKIDNVTSETTNYLSIVIFSIEDFYSDTLIWTKTDNDVYSIKYVNSTDMNIFELEQEEDFDLGLRFNKGLIENATRSSDCKKIIVIAYFKPTLFNEDVTRNYTSTVFTTIFPNLDETNSDIQDLVTTIYKHDNPLSEYICSYWTEGYWYHKNVIVESNKTYVCSFQKMANVAMVSKAELSELLVDFLQLECDEALAKTLKLLKEHLNSFTAADVEKLYYLLIKCEDFTDTDIIMNIIDKILQMPLKIITHAMENYSLNFLDLLEAILECRQKSYISEFKHFAVAAQYLKEDNLTGFYIDCHQFKCQIVFTHDYNEIHQ